MASVYDEIFFILSCRKDVQTQVRVLPVDSEDCRTSYQNDILNFSGPKIIFPIFFKCRDITSVSPRGLSETEKTLKDRSEVIRVIRHHQSRFYEK